MSARVAGGFICRFYDLKGNISTFEKFDMCYSLNHQGRSGKMHPIIMHNKCAKLKVKYVDASAYFLRNAAF